MNIKYVFRLMIFTFLCSCTKEKNPIQNDIVEVKLPASIMLPKKLTSIEFDYTEFDAGDVEEGISITYQFPFTNTGKFPLEISNCKYSCGPCKWPKTPIPPNERGMIEAEFSTKRRIGKQYKTLNVRANTNPIVTTLKTKIEIIDTLNNE